MSHGIIIQRSDGSVIMDSELKFPIFHSHYNLTTDSGYWGAYRVPLPNPFPGVMTTVLVHKGSPSPGWVRPLVFTYHPVFQNYGQGVLVADRSTFDLWWYREP